MIFKMKEGKQMPIKTESIGKSKVWKKKSEN